MSVKLDAPRRNRVLWIFSQKKKKDSRRDSGERVFCKNVKHRALSCWTCFARHMLPMWSIRCLWVAMLSTRPIVNRFYYIPGQIRESCGRVHPGHWCATRKGLISEFCERESKRGHFRTKMARIPRRNDRPMENTLRRELYANRRSSSAHMYRVPQPLTNIFEPRANQVFDQLHQTRDSLQLYFFPVINAQVRIVKRKSRSAVTQLSRLHSMMITATHRNSSLKKNFYFSCVQFI